MSSQPATDTGFSPVQSGVIEAISLGASFSAIARAAGVHRSTIYNWMHSQPGFADAVGKARVDYTEELRDQLRDLAGLALARVRAILENPDTPPAVALKAALAVLNRPHFPDPGWHLPERVESPVQQQALDDLAALHAEDDRMRMAEKLAVQRPEAPAPPPPSSQDAAPPSTPRNAPCPCGSKPKFKRCCGRNAPPQYSNAA